uniref:Uncharacterized protein n=1 Tax=Saimiri boliviensis boliviensis TaxID=39432 RepID=A0A2K6TN98_SAIBB
MFNKCSFHFSIHRSASDNSATSLCAIRLYSEINNLIIYLFSQNSRIRFRKLPLKILLYTSIFSYFELMCEQYVTFIKPSIHYGQSFKFQLLCMSW